MLTNSVEQSSTSEGNRSLASQEISISFIETDCP
jgi:hypothetical protein